MANVHIFQRHAHLAGAVKLEYVNGRDGQVAKAVLTAISNTRRANRGGAADNRDDESTAIQWTLWGKQAENAAEYLGKGSHVNLFGRLRNNNYEKNGETVYGLVFTAEEIDYLDTRAQGEALRSKQGTAPEAGDSAAAGKPVARAIGTRPARGRKGADQAPAEDDVPF